MPTLVRSGYAISLQKGIVHLIESAAIATDDRGAVLVTRWRCGGGSVNAVPVTKEHAAELVRCSNCPQAAQFPTGPAVYRCFDADDVLLYVGSTVNVFQRIRGHRSATRWWDEVDHVEAKGFPTISAARLAESVAIRIECPAYNRDSNTLEVRAS